MPTSEKVLCIPASHFERVGAFEGFRSTDEAYRSALLLPSVFEFRQRSEVETDPNFKQLIPYIVLRAGELMFTYRRGASGTEKRLTALRSVGIGGHISESDAAGGEDLYRTGMMRELNEEVEIRSEYTEQWLGFIYDPRTFVGSVHLGVVHVLNLNLPEAVSREDALVDARFVPLTQLLQEQDQFETWSQFVFSVCQKTK